MRSDGSARSDHDGDDVGHDHVASGPLPGEPDHVDRIVAEWRRERPDLDVAPQGILGRLHRVAGQLTRELVTVFERHGLTEGEFDVLCALRRVGEPFARQPAELARHTMITTGGLTKRLDRLESRRRSTQPSPSTWPTRPGSSRAWTPRISVTLSGSCVAGPGVLAGFQPRSERSATGRP